MLIENEIVMRPINTVKPYIRNPRRNDKTVELLCRIIPKVGFNVPLVIDSKGIIVKGHARFTAAIRLGMTEVPCIITHADEESIKADRIADNKIGEFSEWNNAELMAEINDMDFDLADMGLPKLNLDGIATPEQMREEVAVGTAEADVSEAERQRIYEEFVKAQESESQEDEILQQARKSMGDDTYYKAVCDKCGHITFFKESDFR